MATIAETPHYDPALTREYPRTTSGATLFLITLAVVILGIVLAVVAGIAGVAWLGLVVPVAYFVYLVALLFFAGRAISYRNRPGEAATSILLAVLLSPAIALTPAIGIAGNALSDSGLGSMMGSGLGAGMGDEMPMDDSGGDQWFQSELPPGARDDVTESEYQRFVDCMSDQTTAYDTCMNIVS